MTQKLSQARIQRLQQSTSALVAAIHDARMRFPNCAALRPRQVSALARFLKQLRTLPHHSDFSLFERGLKRRLVRVGHRLQGVGATASAPQYSLQQALPSCYQATVRAYQAEASEALRVLADVPLTREPLLSVSQTLASVAKARRVVFVSRAEAGAYRPVKGSILVSINNPDESLLEPQPGWSAVLHLRLHDVDVPGPGLKVFDSDQAQQVLRFVEPYRHTAPEIVLHCQAGMSRSGGLAVFLSEYLELPCFKGGVPQSALSWPLYNRKVYRTMAQAAYGPVGSAFGPVAEGSDSDA